MEKHYNEKTKRSWVLWTLVIIILGILAFFLLRPNNVIIKGKILPNQQGNFTSGYYDFRIKVESKDVEKEQKTYFVSDHSDISVDSQGRFEISQEIPRGIDKSVAADLIVCYSSTATNRPDGITRDTESVDT